jgi:uncharacterized lipoprotein YbaY
MKRAFLSRLAVCGLGLSLGLPLPIAAQDRMQDIERNQGGISSPWLSRCAGKFGADIRSGDPAFPLLSLLGEPWMTIERTDQTVDGRRIVAVVTGVGVRSRRRGEVVPLTFRCLIDDQGVAASFTAREEPTGKIRDIPESELLRGAASYRPRTLLPPGAELRVQLWDETMASPQLVTEAVVRSSWVDPVPFGLRLPPDVKLGHKLGLTARLSLGSQTLFALKQPLPLSPDHMQMVVDITLDAVSAGAVR